MIDLFKKKRTTSVLGLSLDGNRLEAVVLRKTNAALQIQQSCAVALALSPLTADPELVGREIRNHLDQAGIRERQCVVCLPLSWVLTLQTKLPELPEADLAAFLEIEAERGFPAGHENLQLANSISTAPGKEKYAISMGVPRNHLAQLEKALRAAQLKPISFSLGITAMWPPDKNSVKPVIAVSLDRETIDLQASAGGGILALRSLDSAFETEGASKYIDTDIVERDLRITLGHLPSAFNAEKGTLMVFGRGDQARHFVDDIAPRAKSLGLQIELKESASDAKFDRALPVEIATSGALALAGRYLNNDTQTGPEFLAPKVHPWQQLFAGKISSPKKLIWAGAAAGAILFIVLVAFGWQQWRIMRLESEWDGMKDKVASLQNDQDQIRKYRPFFDESVRSLRILKRLAEVFPEEGTVSAKIIEYRSPSFVICSGTARDQQSLQKVFDQLSASEGVSEVHYGQIHGQNPIQFTFDFQWEGTKANAN